MKRLIRYPVSADCCLPPAKIPGMLCPFTFLLTPSSTSRKLYFPAKRALQTNSASQAFQKERLRSCIYLVLRLTVSIINDAIPLSYGSLRRDSNPRHSLLGLCTLYISFLRIQSSHLYRSTHDIP